MLSKEVPMALSIDVIHMSMACFSVASSVHTITEIFPSTGPKG